MKKTNTLWWGIGIAVVLIALFMYPRLNAPSTDTDVPCLVPNVPLLQHIHPILKIEVDGKNEEIPANIGLGACERAVHTHDDDAGEGVIHVESQDAREYTLGDFFSVWGKTIHREGYSLEATMDGTVSEVISEDLGKSVLFRDGQQIVMKYTKQ